MPDLRCQMAKTRTLGRHARPEASAEFQYALINADNYQISQAQLSVLLCPPYPDTRRYCYGDWGALERE